MSEPLSAYDLLPALIRTAQRTSGRFGVRARIVGTRSPRCGMWHYAIWPILSEPRGDA